MQITKQTKADVLRKDGRMVASCNVAGQHTFDEIVMLRREPIGEVVLTETLSLVCHRFNAALEGSLISYYSRVLESDCGKTEYIAAWEDFMRSKVYFADFLPWILNHVKEQRENGPDLVGLSFHEFDV